MIYHGGGTIDPGKIYGTADFGMDFKSNGVTFVVKRDGFFHIGPETQI